VRMTLAPLSALRRAESNGVRPPCIEHCAAGLTFPRIRTRSITSCDVPPLAVLVLYVRHLPRLRCQYRQYIAGRTAVCCATDSQGNRIRRRRAFLGALRCSVDVGTHGYAFTASNFELAAWTLERRMTPVHYRSAAWAVILTGAWHRPSPSKSAHTSSLRSRAATLDRRVAA
jgi:hypothetical protein